MLRCVCRNNCAKVAFCKKFNDLSVEDRHKYAVEARLCLNCLSRSHFCERCPSDKGCKHCGAKHNTLLHPPSLPHPEKCEQGTQADLGDHRFAKIREEATYILECLQFAEKWPHERRNFNGFAMYSVKQILLCLPTDK